jgi:hypothetical protein
MVARSYVVARTSRPYGGAMGWEDAGDLLAGPRGRRLCWSLLDPGDCPEWDLVWDGAQAGDLAGRTAELATCVARTDLDSIVAGASELSLLAALAQPVELAMYWQEPDDEDHAIADKAVQAVLRPVARAVTTAPAARWWPAPVAIDRQRYAERLSEHDDSPTLTGTAAKLAAWRHATLEDERSAEKRPEDPSASWSGHWWSTPALSRLPSTTRSIPGIGAVGLALVEDGLGWREARCWPAAPRSNARVYEISGPGQWIDLVGRYPLDVSRSRRHDWWRVTGWAGPWLIPDFVAVAADYDAIHLSVAGYLVTAGRALPVGDACTLLAGWDPDETYWLTDTLALAGPPTTWVNEDEGSTSWVVSKR